MRLNLRSTMIQQVVIAGLILVWVNTTGCTQVAEPLSDEPLPESVASIVPALPETLQPVSVARLPLPPSPAPCQATFTSHTLDHITTVKDEVVHLFDSNGSGLAINDLDNDGDLDIVLANLAGSNSIFWNEAQLTFRKETLPHGASRAVNIVDVDGDGWLDIVFARRKRARPTLWLNEGNPDKPSFSEAQFKVRNPYTMSWADMDHDGDLDFVAASYDAELEKAGQYDKPLGGGGIIYYEHQAGKFMPTTLAYTAQTLALLLVDLNTDGYLDIMAGNDFFLPDQVWLRQANGWREVRYFSATTRNTMSFALGDLNNDGRFELFATDMKPYANDSETLAAWAPVMAKMQAEERLKGDTQTVENVLHRQNDWGRFENLAPASGLAATGWSWSAKFGDLDNDGFLDVYVVNGMIAAEMFDHLPNDELVEENQAFRNDGAGKFLPASGWGLNATASGRGMSLADLDNDGDLDIVVNNLLTPAQIFENRLCSGAGLEVDLLWPDSKNSRGIGAQATLHTDVGSYHRQVNVASGYLSGDPARLHFGFPDGSKLVRLDIRWPDGAHSSVDELASQTLLQITRE